MRTDESLFQNLTANRFLATKTFVLCHAQFTFSAFLNLLFGYINYYKLIIFSEAMRDQDNGSLVYEEVARDNSRKIFVYSVRLPGATGAWKGRVGYRARTAPYSELGPNGNGSVIEVVVNGPGLSKAEDRIMQARTIQSDYDKISHSITIRRQKRAAHKALNKSRHVSAPRSSDLYERGYF